MNRHLSYILLFALTVFIAATLTTTRANSDECAFESVQADFDPDLAESDAEKAYGDEKRFFYGVATGIGPTRPGFERVPLTKCLTLDTEWKMLWVGSDSTSCKDGAALSEKATEYSKIFNTKMIQLLKEDANFGCVTDLQGAR